MSEIVHIKVTDLYPHPDNPRQDVGDASELADSIKAAGILQNLTVVPGHKLTQDEWRDVMAKYQKNPTEELRTLSNTRQSQDGYTVIIGHRRLAAAKLAGLETVPCVVVSMPLQEQIATMLLENMQRSDLTYYEQAQGIQMMLDMGETVDTVAQKTGFSKTTVRNRVKLLDLDQEEFKKSVERGATLQDYAALEAISDPALKNTVLQSIGTANFQQQLKAAEKQEQNNAYLAESIAALESFAIRITAVDGSTMRWCGRYDVWNKKAVQRPEDAGKTRYYFWVSGSYVELYRQKEASQPDAEAELERQRQQEEDEARWKKLEELTAQAYQLRTEFVANYSLTAAKKHLPQIVMFAAQVMLPSISGVDPIPDWDLLGKLLEIAVDAEREWIDIPAYHDAIRVCPAYALLCTAYAALDDPTLSYAVKDWDKSAQRWNIHFEFSDALDLIYDFLESLGYQKSDMEKSLRDGEHPLFDK